MNKTATMFTFKNAFKVNPNSTKMHYIFTVFLLSASNTEYVAVFNGLCKSDAPRGYALFK